MSKKIYPVLLAKARTYSRRTIAEVTLRLLSLLKKPQTPMRMKVTMAMAEAQRLNLALKVIPRRGAQRRRAVRAREKPET